MSGNIASVSEGSPRRRAKSDVGGKDDSFIRRGPPINVEVMKAKTLMESMINDTSILDEMESRIDKIIPKVQERAPEAFRTGMLVNSSKLKEVNSRIPRLKKVEGEMREGIVGKMPPKDTPQNIAAGMAKIVEIIKPTESQPLGKFNETEMDFCDKFLGITNEIVEIQKSVGELQKFELEQPAASQISTSLTSSAENEVEDLIQF